MLDFLKCLKYALFLYFPTNYFVLFWFFSTFWKYLHPNTFSSTTATRQFQEQKTGSQGRRWRKGERTGMIQCTDRKILRYLFQLCWHLQFTLACAVFLTLLKLLCFKYVEVKLWLHSVGIVKLWLHSVAIVKTMITQCEDC